MLKLKNQPQLKPRAKTLLKLYQVNALEYVRCEPRDLMQEQYLQEIQRLDELSLSSTGTVSAAQQKRAKSARKKIQVFFKSLKETQSKYLNLYPDQDTSSPMDSLSQTHSGFDQYRKRVHEELMEYDSELLDEILYTLSPQGYLPISIEELSSELELNQASVQRLLGRIKEVEPLGGASLNFDDYCLFLLGRGSQDDPQVQFYMDFFENHAHDFRIDPQTVADRIQLSMEELRELLTDLPKFGVQTCPFSGLNMNQLEADTLPEIEFELGDDGEVEAKLLHDVFSESGGSTYDREYYEKVAEQVEDPKVLKALAREMKERRDFLYLAYIRSQNLINLARFLAKYQRSFFVEGERGIRTLTCKMVREDTGMSESVISRCLQNKYFRFNQRCYELSTLFSTGVKNERGEKISRSRIKALIKEWIEREDPKDPLRDEDLQALIYHSENLNLTRRVVNKYRSELKIPTYNKRRLRG